jgi:hypothetical protein
VTGDQPSPAAAIGRCCREAGRLLQALADHDDQAADTALSAYRQHLAAAPETAAAELARIWQRAAWYTGEIS